MGEQTNAKPPKRESPQDFMQLSETNKNRKEKQKMNKRSAMTVIVGMMVLPVLLGIGFAMLLNGVQPEARGSVALIVAVFVFLMVIFSRWAMVRVK